MVNLEWVTLYWLPGFKKFTYLINQLFLSMSPGWFFALISLGSLGGFICLLCQAGLWGTHCWLVSGPHNFIWWCFFSDPFLGHMLGERECRRSRKRYKQYRIIRDLDRVFSTSGVFLSCPLWWSNLDSWGILSSPSLAIGILFLASDPSSSMSTWTYSILCFPFKSPDFFLLLTQWLGLAFRTIKGTSFFLCCPHQ